MPFHKAANLARSTANFSSCNTPDFLVRKIPDDFYFFGSAFFYRVYNRA